MNPENLKSGDTDDLEALFDQIAEQKIWEQGDDEPAPATVQTAAPAPVAESGGETPVRTDLGEMIAKGSEDPLDVFQRVGMLTRKLHDALRELGYDKNVETAINGLPDARARLAYIANVTGQAAEKVLSAVESSQNLTDQISERAAKLDAQWDKLYNHQMTLEEFKVHTRENREFIRDLTQKSGAINSHLTDIMIAQDFHDLTGQVVKKIATMAQNLEEQLVQLLLDTTPSDQRKQVQDTWLNGPVINPEGRSDVCSNQGQVDDLLESLGF
ncbi:protein phosphatase CheZ [Limnobacter litoralis]|uniref:Protein phosphatase CheZ n=1 Tax=Limnobacter litoralis TaxID=481366 RepID=A0ABQ5YQ32_9BURK|nr:protein phosphatase CheZ [Limnobacter litoralis]GLR26709.1 protein phosphatase CheZ [Limnobacter litoralis]